MPTQTAEILRMGNPLQVNGLRNRLSNPKLANGVEEDLSTPLAVLLAFDTGMDAIEVDTLLSPAGQADAAAKLARTANAKLDAFANAKVGGLESRIAAETTRLTNAEKPPTELGDRIIAELRAQEIRAMFRPLDPIERTFAYLSVDDGAVRDALESAPPMMVRLRPGDMPTLQPFVDPERVKERVLARAEARNPAAAAELRDFEALARVYRSVVSTAKLAIAEVVPSEGPAIVVVGA